MTEEKISIIIPVYKVEEYLETCLDSVLAQTYQNLEILLVDDGSPDRCGEICDRYAQKDKRIRVIHKKNEGVAGRGIRRWSLQAATISALWTVMTGSPLRRMRSCIVD